MERPIDAEAPRLLARREFLEGGEELTNILLRRYEQEDALHAPTFIVHAFMVRGLEGIRAQVEELREAQGYERFLPDVKAMRTLLGEDDFPLVVAKANKRAVVIEIEELVARTR